MFEKGLLSTSIDYAGSGLDKASSTRAQNYEGFATDVRNSQGVISARNSIANRNIKEEDLFIKLLMDEQGLNEQEAKNLAATIKANYLRGLRHRDTGISTASFGDYNEIYQQSNLKGGGNYVFNMERDEGGKIKGFDRKLLGGEDYIPGTGIKIIKAPKRETGIRGLYDTGAGRTASAVGGDMGISSDIAFTLAQRGIAEEYDPYSIYYRDAVVDDPNTPEIDETAAAIDSIRIYDTFQPQEGLDTYAKAITVLDESLILNSTQFQALADNTNANATFRNPTTGGFGFYQGAINDERMRYRRDHALKYIEPALERGMISPSIIRNYVNDSQAVEDKYRDIDAILNDQSLTDVLAQYETRVSIEDKPIGPDDKGKSLSELQKDYDEKVDALNITEDQKTYVKGLFKTDWKEAQKGSLINRKAEFADYAKDVDNIEFKRTQGGFTGTIKSSEDIDDAIATNNLTPLNLSEYAVNLAVEGGGSIFDPLDISESESNIRDQMEREFVRTKPLSEEDTETGDDTFTSIGRNIDTVRDQSKLNRSARSLSLALGANVLSIEEKIKRITPFIDNLNSLSPKVAEKLITSISKFVQTNQDTLDPGYIEYVNSMITQNQEEEDTLVKANIPTQAQGGTILRNIPRFEGGGGIENITVKGKKLDSGGGRSYGGLGSMSGPRGGYGFSSERLADIRAEENIENRIGEDIKTGMAEGYTPDNTLMTEGIMSKPRISKDDHWLDRLDDVRNMPDDFILEGIDQTGDTLKEWGDKQGPAGKFIVKDVLGNTIKSIGWIGRQIKKGTDLPVDTGKILVKKVEEAFDEKKETD